MIKNAKKEFIIKIILKIVNSYPSPIDNSTEALELNKKDNFLSKFFNVYSGNISSKVFGITLLSIFSIRKSTRMVFKITAMLMNIYQINILEIKKF